MFALASPLRARRNEEMTDKFYGGQEDGECQGYYSATDLSVLWHAIVDIWRGITCVAMFGREFRVNQIHREFVSDHREKQWRDQVPLYVQETSMSLRQRRGKNRKGNEQCC